MAVLSAVTYIIFRVLPAVKKEQKTRILWSDIPTCMSVIGVGFQRKDVFSSTSGSPR